MTKPIFDEKSLEQLKVIQLRTDVDLLLKEIKTMAKDEDVNIFATETEISISENHTNIKRLKLAMGGYADLAKRLKALETICE